MKTTTHKFRLFDDRLVEIERYIPEWTKEQVEAKRKELEKSGNGIIASACTNYALASVLAKTPESSGVTLEKLDKFVDDNPEFVSEARAQFKLIGGSQYRSLEKEFETSIFDKGDTIAIIVSNVGGVIRYRTIGDITDDTAIMIHDERQAKQAAIPLPVEPPKPKEQVYKTKQGPFYEINVTKNGAHLFATDSSIRQYPKNQIDKLVTRLSKAFPTEDGYLVESIARVSADQQVIYGPPETIKASQPESTT